MKLEDFKIFVSKSGFPSPDMTDEKWQEYFNLLKLSIKPSTHKKMTKCSSPSEINGFNEDGVPVYHGETQWDRYCSYINSVLKSIRAGYYDYCYYVYHISELLKYEHDRLRTKYVQEDNCFTVWLEEPTQPRKEDK